MNDFNHVVQFYRRVPTPACQNRAGRGPRVRSMAPGPRTAKNCAGGSCAPYWTAATQAVSAAWLLSISGDEAVTSAGHGQHRVSQAAGTCLSSSIFRRKFPRARCLRRDTRPLRRSTFGL